MVVGVGAAPVDRLAVLAAQHVDEAVVGVQRERAVDRRQPDAGAARGEQLVHLLRRPEVVDRAERVEDGLRAAGWLAAAGSVLVIVRPLPGDVDGVPVAVVDVVDVVVVLDRDVAAVRARARAGGSRASGARSGTPAANGAVQPRRAGAARPRAAR